MINIFAKAKSVTVLFLFVILLASVSGNADAHSYFCIHGPWSTYDLNLRMISNITAQDLLNYSYVETETYGRRLEPNPTGYMNFAYYEAPIDYGTSKTIHWSTTQAWRVDMYGYFALGQVFYVYDPTTYIQGYCPNSAVGGGDWVIP